MRLLGYFLALSVRRTLAALGLLIAVYVSIDLVESSSSAGVTLGTLLAVYPFKLPSMLSHLAAPASALGVLLAYGRLLEGGELDALRAAGISTGALVVRLLPVPLAMAALMIPAVSVWGPAGLARYDGECVRGGGSAGDGGWRREGEWLTRRGGEEELFLRRDPGDGAVIWIETEGEGGRRWTDSEGWSVSGLEELPPQPSQEVGVPVPGAFGLVGGALTSSCLEETIAEASGAGLDTSALRAQLALRPTLASGALLVPLLALLVAARFRLARPVRLVALGVVGCALYWVTTSAAWNAVGGGLLSGAWLWPGVPVLWGGVLVVVVVLWGAGRRGAATRR